MTMYKVLYQLPGKEFSFFDRNLVVAGLDQTHAFLTEVEACSVEEVYRMMQAEFWSPNGEARGLIRSLGLDHTSMSVNDMVQDPYGQYWQCLMAGWRKLN